MKYNLKSFELLFPVAVAGSLFFVSAQTSLAAAYYTVVDLGTLGGTQSEADGINNSGQIVGYAFTTGNAANHAAFWNNSSSSAIDLGTLGGSDSQALGINTFGQIVGKADTASATHAAFWNNSSSSAIDLGTLGGTTSGANGINNSEQIVGSATIAGGSTHAAFWNNSSSSAIDLPGGFGDSSAYNINGSGRIVGLASFLGTGTDIVTHAAFWANSSSSAVDLGTLGGSRSIARGINSSGHIVGDADATCCVGHHAAFWNNSSSSAIDLGTLGGDNSAAQGINSSGQIVGFAFTTGNAAFHAAFWNNSSSPAIDLNTLIPANSGWDLTVATAINDTGMIVGYGFLGGHTHAFALIPISPPPSPYLQVQPPDVYVILAPWPPPCLHCTNVFSVQRTTNLVSGAWSTIASNIVGTGGVITNIDLGGATVPQRFYRVGLHIPNVKEASDDASNAAYTNGWATGKNDGFGYGSWTLRVSNTNSTSGNGFFVGSSTNNASGASPGIDVGGKSWGLYANSNNLAVAYRAISNSVAVGGTFGIEMDNGNIESNNAVGFVLRSGNVSSNATSYTTGARFQFEYIGFDSSNSYKVVDSGGQHNIGVPFTGTGLRLVFTLTGANTYTLQTINNASGTTNTFSGTLAGVGTLDSIALFNNNAGSNSPHDAFFNLMEIGSP